MEMAYVGIDLFLLVEMSGKQEEQKAPARAVKRIYCGEGER